MILDNIAIRLQFAIKCWGGAYTASTSQSFMENYVVFLASTIHCMNISLDSELWLN